MVQVNFDSIKVSGRFFLRLIHRDILVFLVVQCLFNISGIFLTRTVIIGVNLNANPPHTHTHPTGTGRDVASKGLMAIKKWDADSRMDQEITAELRNVPGLCVAMLSNPCYHSRFSLNYFSTDVF